jgi:hypothetical protein
MLVYSTYLVTYQIDSGTKPEGTYDKRRINVIHFFEKELHPDICNIKDTTTSSLILKIKHNIPQDEYIDENYTEIANMFEHTPQNKKDTNIEKMANALIDKKILASEDKVIIYKLYTTCEIGIPKLTFDIAIIEDKKLVPVEDSDLYSFCI